MINKVTLVGHAGGEPDVRKLEGGSTVARVSLATNESYKDKEGNWQTTTEWHNLILWREMAERAAQNIKKGSTVFVDGKLSYRKYTDKDGVEKTVTDIVVSHFRVLDKKEHGDNGRMPDVEPQRNSNDAGKAYQEAERDQYGDSPTTGDDLPF